jgi:hypothetical protein
MCRSVAPPCLIGLGRSRVISYHSRDAGSMHTCGKKVRNNDVRYENGVRNNDVRYENGDRTQQNKFLGVLVPSVSLKARSLLALLI